MATTRDYTDFLNDQVDIAPANSQEELNAAELIESLFAQHGLETQLQEFETSSLSGLSNNIYLIILFVGVVLAGFVGTPVSIVGLVVVLLSFVLIVLARRGMDVLESIGPQARSQNVIGVHHATGPNVIKGNRPIVIVAHYDTPRENFFNGPQLAKWQPLIKRLSWPLCIMVFVFSLLQIPPFIPVALRHVFWAAGVLLALPLLLQGAAAVYERFATCTTGASDNKASVAAMLGVLDMVRPGPDDAKEWAKSNPRGVRRQLVEEVEDEYLDEDEYFDEDELDEEEYWDDEYEDESPSEQDESAPYAEEEFEDEYVDDDSSEVSGAVAQPSAMPVDVPHVDEEWEPEAEEEAAAPVDTDTYYEATDDAYEDEEYEEDEYEEDEYEEDEYGFALPSGVRRGPDFLASLQVLPEDCEIEYVDLVPRDELMDGFEFDESSYDFDEYDEEGQSAGIERSAGFAGSLSEVLSSFRDGAIGLFERIKEFFANLIAGIRDRRNFSIDNGDETEIFEPIDGDAVGSQTIDELDGAYEQDEYDDENYDEDEIGDYEDDLEAAEAVDARRDDTLDDDLIVAAEAYARQAMEEDEQAGSYGLVEDTVSPNENDIPYAEWEPIEEAEAEPVQDELPQGEPIQDAWQQDEPVQDDLDTTAPAIAVSAGQDMPSSTQYDALGSTADIAPVVPSFVGEASDTAEMEVSRAVVSDIPTPRPAVVEEEPEADAFGVEEEPSSGEWAREDVYPEVAAEPVPQQLETIADEEPVRLWTPTPDALDEEGEAWTPQAATDDVSVSAAAEELQGHEQTWVDAPDLPDEEFAEEQDAYDQGDISVDEYPDEGAFEGTRSGDLTTEEGAVEAAPYDEGLDGSFEDRYAEGPSPAEPVEEDFVSPYAAMVVDEPLDAEFEVLDDDGGYDEYDGEGYYEPSFQGVPVEVVDTPSLAIGNDETGVLFAAINASSRQTMSEIESGSLSDDAPTETVDDAMISANANAVEPVGDVEDATDADSSQEQSFSESELDATAEELVSEEPLEEVDSPAEAEEDYLEAPTISADSSAEANEPTAEEEADMADIPVEEQIDEETVLAEKQLLGEGVGVSEEYRREKRSDEEAALESLWESEAEEPVVTVTPEQRSMPSPIVETPPMGTDTNLLVDDLDEPEGFTGPLPQVGRDADVAGAVMAPTEITLSFDVPSDTAETADVEADIRSSIDMHEVPREPEADASSVLHQMFMTAPERRSYPDEDEADTPAARDQDVLHEMFSDMPRFSPEEDEEWMAPVPEPYVRPVEAASVEDAPQEAIPADTDEDIAPLGDETFDLPESPDMFDGLDDSDAAGYDEAFVEPVEEPVVAEETSAEPIPEDTAAHHEPQDTYLGDLNIDTSDAERFTLGHDDFVEGNGISVPETDETVGASVEAELSEDAVPLEEIPSEQEVVAAPQPELAGDMELDEPPSDDLPEEPVQSAVPEQPAYDPDATILAEGITFSLEEDVSEEELADKDVTGLTAISIENEADVEDSMPPYEEHIPKPRAVDDPDWGKSSFKPAGMSVGRRAMLLDLPDPSVRSVDPFEPTEDTGAFEDPQKQVETMRRFESLSRVPSPLDAPATAAAPRPHRPSADSIPEIDEVETEPDGSAEEKPLQPYNRGKASQGTAKEQRKRPRFGRRRKDEEQVESLGEFLGLGDDYDAKKDGRQIGSWDHFDDDDRRNGWKGGATLRAGLRDDGSDDENTESFAVPAHNFDSLDLVGNDEDYASENDGDVEGALDDEQMTELREAVLRLGDDDLIAHDVWFVGLGASTIDHAGIKAFLDEHRRDIRGAFLVNLDSVGAGDLTLLTREGMGNKRRADRRMVRMLSSIADALHINMGRADYSWETTDATPAMQRSVRVTTIMGMSPDGVAAHSRTPDDEPEYLNDQQIADVADIVAELIRRS